MNTADGVDMVDTNQDEKNVKNTEKNFCVTTVKSCENHAGIVFYPNLSLFLMVSVTLKLSGVCDLNLVG